MAAAASSGVYSSTATQLTNIAAATETEKLFQAALVAVRAESTNSDVLDKLSSARNAEELTKAFTVQVEKSGFWGTKVTRWTRLTKATEGVVTNFSRFSNPITNMAAFSSSVALPVWGAVCMVTTVIQEILDTKDSLVKFQEYVGYCIERFEAFNSHASLRKYLTRPLQNFYVIIIKFCHTAIKLFEISGFGTARVVLSKSAGTDLDNLLQSLKAASDNIDKSVPFQNMEDIQDLGRRYAKTAWTPHSPLPFTATRTNWRVPDLLTSDFTGRDFALEFIQSRFTHSLGSTPARVALWGVRGVGKSQISMQFARARHPNSAHPQKYEHIFFVRAGSPQTLFSGYSMMANALGLCHHSVEPVEQDVLVGQVNEWLRSNTKWLLIFDNAQITSEVRRFTPTLGTGHIIFTANSPQVAEALTSTEGIMEIPPMTKNEAVELVFKIQNIAPDCQPSRRAAAEQLCTLVRGLPIAIEQSVRDADRRAITIERMNMELQNSSAILEQQFPASLHESVSVASILKQSLKQVGERNAQAAELFKVLVFLDNNSIPIEVLTTGGPQLNSHFNRTGTYDRGVVVVKSESTSKPSTQDNVPKGKSKRQSRSPAYALRRLVKSGSSKPDENEFLTPLPRTDTVSDELLQEHYNSNKFLQNLFSNPLLIDNAINDLQHSGLVRKPTDKTIWIHDLYAQMTRALVELEAKLQKQVTIHFAATLVFLACPIPGTPPEPYSTDACFAMLPTVMRVLHHCDKTNVSVEGDEIQNLCTDSTIGPELCHLAGCSLYLSLSLGAPVSPVFESWLFPASEHEGQRCLSYFRTAGLGYCRAAERLHATPGVTVEWIRRRAEANWQYFEDRWSLYEFERRFIWNAERFGSAPIRAMNLYVKLGQILSGRTGAGTARTEEAIACFKRALKIAELIYGESHLAYASTVTDLCSTYEEAGEWEKVLETVDERVAFYRSHFPDNWSIVDYSDGPSLARYKAHALQNLGRLEGAESYYLLVLLGIQYRQGGDSTGCWSVVDQLISMELKRGNLDAARAWLAKLVSVREKRGPGDYLAKSMLEMERKSAAPIRAAEEEAARKSD